MKPADGAKVKASLSDAFAKILKNPRIWFAACFLVMTCGSTKKFQTFPMPYIAGQSKCTKVVDKLPSSRRLVLAPGHTVIDGHYFEPVKWLEQKDDCKEKAKVFLFVTESFTITTANLVFFGVVKAIFNFVTGVCCDKFGRRMTLIIGWVLGIPMPFMVIFATSWWTAAFSNLFLGMQQALAWSATIFIMVDVVGNEHAGLAIGINETIGYTTIAIVNVIAAAILNEDYPREGCYYVVLALIAASLVIGGLMLQESKPLAVSEDAKKTSRAEDAVKKLSDSKLVWPSERESSVTVAQSAFVYTSFINKSLMAICFAGLMINFLSGFAWGLFVKWMKNDYEVDGTLKWEALSKETVANISLCYGLPKGVLQFMFGFVGDTVGRKWLIVGGLSSCVLGLVILAATGEGSDDPVAGFVVGALFVGIGTGVMYTNNLAAVVDHSDPSWRSSALGAYRFWRDLGYAVGALLTGLFADAIGIFGSVLVAAALTSLAATSVALAYEEAEKPEEDLTKV